MEEAAISSSSKALWTTIDYNDQTLEEGVQTIERVLRGEPEIMDEVNKNKQLQLMAITGVLRDDYCENCYEKGHRIWACPQKIIKKNDI